MILLEEGPNNATVDKDQLRSILNSLQPTDFVLLVVQPTAAEEIWEAAYELVSPSRSRMCISSVRKRCFPSNSDARHQRFSP